MSAIDAAYITCDVLENVCRTRCSVTTFEREIN